MQVMSLLLLLLAFLVPGSFGACPDLDTGLTPFSTSGLADGLTKSSNVSITSAILLDQDLDVSFIDISGTGSLVFKRGRSTVVKTLGIAVRDSASLVIGSEDCRHEDPVNIILQGERDPVEALSDYGQKYILVQDEASLFMFGRDKLTWTKLTATADRYNVNQDIIVYEHKKSTYSSLGAWHQGLILYIFNGTTLEPTKVKTFDMVRKEPARESDVVGFIINNLNDVPSGSIVMMAVNKHIGVSDRTILSPLFDKIELEAGMEVNSSLFRDTQMFDAFAMIFVKDSPELTRQSMVPRIASNLARATAVLELGANRLVAESVVSPITSSSYVDFRIFPLELASPTINVLHDISSWNVGDEIVLTSSDFKLDHAEVRKIKAIPSANSIQLDGELLYRHFGEIENQIDMRGEVGVLTRNIKIEGEMSRECPVTNENCDDLKYDSFGGHLKMLFGFGAVHIEGVEFYHMGQTSQLGTYPIHFHMCLNVTEKTSMVKKNSIHHTFQRAVTVHGTYGASETNLGVSVIDNFAFEISGHAYFLEDGIEMATLLQHNLGANIRNVKNKFNTDQGKATVFWITNPKVLLIDNVAAGSEGFGIWYTFPVFPVGPSADIEIKVYQRREAKFTPLWTVDNNVVHSCKKGGFNFDNILRNAVGTVGGCMSYQARANPLDPSSANVKVQISRLTAYKNIGINLWIRGGYFEVIQFSSAESHRGVQLVRGSNQKPFVKKSVFMGPSIGNFEDESYPDRTRLNHYTGIVLVDGPVYVHETSFLNFASDPNGAYFSRALGFKNKNVFSSSVGTSIYSVKFGYSDATEGNRVLDGNNDDEDHGLDPLGTDRVVSFRDIDGSVSNCPGVTWPGPSQIVKPEKFLLTERCQYRPNWKLVVCNDLYGKVVVRAEKFFGDSRSTFVDHAHMRRVRFDDPSDVEYEVHKTAMIPEYMVILGDDPREFYYEFQFSEPTDMFPAEIFMTIKGVERGLGAVVGMCLPENVLTEDIVLQTQMSTAVVYDMTSLVEVASIQEVSSSKFMNAIYRNGRMLYFKFETWVPRDPAWDKYDVGHCSQRQCPTISFKFKQAYNYTPCFNPTEDKLNNFVDAGELGVANMTCDLPASDPAYESNWGAGDFERDVDGVWGEWSSWSDCCAEGSDTTTRYRVCDNPSPYGNGADCAGDATESAPCTQDCPVDAVFTEWSAWSVCTCTGEQPGSTGSMTRTRTCNGVANFGQSCSGALSEISACPAGCEYDEN